MGFLFSFFFFLYFENFYIRFGLLSNELKSKGIEEQKYEFGKCIDCIL